MKISDEYPARNGEGGSDGKYVVKRDGMFFTAMPCYGLHEPWWVVRTMGRYPNHEAPPVVMYPEDEWWPLKGFSGGM